MTNIGFPGLARVNGDLMTVYRSAANHAVGTGANRGIIYRETSTDDGATWGSKTTVVDDVNGYDARDPTMLVTTAGTVLVFHTIAQSSTIYAPYVARSTNNGSSWSEIAITNNYTDFALSAGEACQAANGDILCATYGEDTGDGDSSVRVSRSSDDAQTWSHLAEIADGPAASRSYQEPSLIRLPNDDILCVMRTDDTVFYRSVSSDNGATWSSPTSMVWPGEGRPALLRLSTGEILLWFRRFSLYGFFRVSYDDGVTFVAPMRFSRSTNQPIYAQMVELSPRVVGVAWGDETSATVAAVKFGKLVT